MDTRQKQMPPETMHALSKSDDSTLPHNLAKTDKDANKASTSQSFLTTSTDVKRIIADKLAPEDVYSLGLSHSSFAFLLTEPLYWKKRLRMHFPDDYKSLVTEECNAEE